MKLLFDVTELSYYNENSGHKAGVYNVSLNLLNELKSMGCDISLYCDFKRYYFFKEIEEFKDFHILKENSIINRLWGKLIFALKNTPIRIQYLIIILARFYDAYFYRINKKNLKQIEQFDAYFSPFTPPSEEIQFANIKRYRMLHDVIPIIENGYPKTPKDWYYKIYTTINNKDFYFTNSDCTKKDVLKYFPQINNYNIKTALLGANKSFKPSIEKFVNEKYVFSLCTLGKRKNLIFVIDNFFKFIEKNNITDLKLVIGGGIWNNYQKEFSETIKKYDSSKIIVTGYISEEELNKYYSNALCFVYPSLYEGFGLPVLEAMQCGCPVITSNISSLPEVIGDAGIQINPKACNELIEAFEKMYFNYNFRQDCSLKGIERAKLFSWGKCANEILEFIKSTV